VHLDVVMILRPVIAHENHQLSSLLVAFVVSLEATANALMEVLAARHPTSGSNRLTGQQAHGLDEGHDTPKVTKVLIPPAARNQPDPNKPPHRATRAGQTGARS